MKKKYVINIFFLLVLLIIGFHLVYPLILSNQYKLPFNYVFDNITKQSIGSLIYLTLKIYDPTDAVEVSLAPENLDINNNDLIRIEEFLGREKEIFEIMSLKNEKIIRSNYHFGYQPFNEPILSKLRINYKLDSLIATAEDELDAMLQLRNWARSQFRRNDYQPGMRDFNALLVLERNLRNVNNLSHSKGQYRPCNFFPLFFSQILLSVGYIPRVCTISFGEKYIGHGVVEVWSNQFNKWIIMDADLNLHYEKNGIPMNLLELHNERYNTNASNIKIVFGNYSDKSINTSSDSSDNRDIEVENMVNYCSYFGIADMRNDWATNHYFPGHPRRSDRSQLYWLDKKMPKLFNPNPKTSTKNDFYWMLNQTEIYTFKDANVDSTLPLIFKTVTPNFDHFDITLNDSTSVAIDEATYNWKITAGINKIEIVSANKFGIKGIPSAIELIRN